MIAIIAYASLTIISGILIASPALLAMGRVRRERRGTHPW